MGANVIDLIGRTSVQTTSSLTVWLRVHERRSAFFASIANRLVNETGRRLVLLLVERVIIAGYNCRGLIKLPL